MLNMNQFISNPVADNTVVINGASFKVTDDVAMKILTLCTGQNIGNISQSTNIASTPQAPVKTKYVATKDFNPQYEIKEQVATDGTKLFCISRKNGWTRAEKSCMNNAIKSLKGIKEIEVSYEKDGKTRSYKAWGYGTKATAQKHLAELPTVFTPEQLNA